MGIIKDVRFENKYILNADSATDDLKNVLRGKKVRCIICNKNTAKSFRIGLFGTNIITINNNMEDGVFFVNGVF